MAFSGYQRMALSWWLSADPQVSNAKVFWNNGRDSLEIPVSSGGEPQKIEVLIDGLEEGVYLFEIYTYDDKDNRSLPLEVSGEVYGESYLSGLSNRSATSIELMDGKLYISWRSEERRVGKECVST